MKTWLNEIDKYGGGHVAKLLVGNKSDLKSKRVVPYETALVSTTQFYKFCKTCNNLVTFHYMTTQLSYGIHIGSY